jgi:hypothetical protein
MTGFTIVPIFFLGLLIGYLDLPEEFELDFFSFFFSFSFGLPQNPRASLAILE